MSTWASGTPVAVDASRATWRMHTDAFRRWFAGSKVVDATGEPLIVFHGTRRDFHRFDASAPQATPYLWGDHGLGFFFTEDRGCRSDSGPWTGAAGFARTLQVDGETVAAAGANIVPVYLAIVRPAALAHTCIDGAALRRELEAAGYDGVHLAERRTWVAFHPSQIKSIFNPGSFDPTNPSIVDAPRPLP